MKPGSRGGIAPLDSDAYLKRLTTKAMGRDPHFMDSVSSTNDWSIQRLGQGEIERMVAAAERQTEGRGRMGRQWITPAGVSLAFSLAWPAPEGLRNPGLITLTAGVALAESAREACGARAWLKYPNDLLLDGRKAAGILTELKTGPAGRFAVIGVGMNVNTTAEMFPQPLADTATSLYICTGRKASREEALAGFLNRLEPELELLANGGTKDIMDRYRALAAPMFGRQVVICGAGGDFSGAAEGVTGEGELIVRMADGAARLVSSGEVTFRAAKQQAKGW